jgi:hypothetical protein
VSHRKECGAPSRICHCDPARRPRSDAVSLAI